MQVDGTRMYRVRDVAEGLDVSVATIYRAIESGVLPALKVGIGKGALRIPGAAVQEYMRICEQAARQAVRGELSPLVETAVAVPGEQDLRVVDGGSW